jgi:threonine/homoserine/homoserine lactone efflux protein
LAAARARGWLRGSPATQRRLARAVGTLLMLAAAWTLARGLLPGH